MPIQHLLYASSLKVNEYISIVIPTVDDVLEREDDYYGLISLIIATPQDLMVQLDDAGIDFSTINNWELFLMLFNSFKTQDTSIVFGDLDLSRFEPTINTQNEHIVLRDAESGIVLDRAIHGQICAAIRKIHHLEENIKKPANAEGKKYMLERARIKMNRKKNKVEGSQLENLIISLVNTEQFHYDYDSVRKLSIYQFNESVYQIMKKIDFDNRMRGIYAGTINAKEMKPEELTWLSQHK